MRPSARWRLKLGFRTQSLIRFAILFAWTLFASSAVLAQVTQVSLTPLATPSSGQPGVSSITVIGSNFPAGTISGPNVTVSFTASGGTTPGATTTATSVSVVAGTTERVLFSIPSGLSVSSPTSFKVSIAGTTSTGTAFASSNSALLTVDPPSSVTISPASAQQSQTLSIALTGAFTHFYQGLTTVSFGSGATVNLLTVSSLTSATANITVASSAPTGSQTMTVTTGSESASTPFTVTPAPPSPTTTTAANASIGFSASPQNVTLSATVTSTAGTVNAGTVTFTVSSGGTQLGSSVTSGTVTAGAASAIYALPASVAAGSYTITAVYNAAGGFASSSENTHSLTVTPTAETLTITTVGTGTGTVADNTSAISCSTAGGKQSGTCSANYTNGTALTLTETATSPSSFAGWGGACASFGTAAVCTLTMNSSLSVTADIVPPPASQNLMFPVGTNPPPQTAVFNCPSNPNPTSSNPCTDPNAHTFQLAIPQVTGGLMVTVTATEVPPTLADGLCEVGNTVLNDFDCRFATFFNYGTDTHGNTIVPLCYPYANGNCVHYAVYAGTPGNEPDPSLYSGGVNWTITWNNDTYTPPAPWAGSIPQLYDDPDAAPTPTSAIGTICTQPMTINGAQQSYSCQFEFDITTFFNPTEVVDSGIGGNTKNFNDVVVAFPPILAGQLAITSTADAATVNVGSAIGFTINVSNSGPGSETNVALNDPLPSGSGVTWSISPAYSGPGTCSIGGSIGSQVLSCSLGTLASGSSASLHVTGASPGVGVYVNAAKESSSNQQYLSIATTTVQAPTTTTAANASASVSSGNQNVTLTATVASTAGTVNGGSVTFTVSQGGTTIGTPVTSGTVAGGAASATYVLPANTPAGSYTITAVYNEGTGFETSSDNTHTFTVTSTAVTLQSVTIAGATSSIAAGQTDAFTATGHYSNGTTAALTTGVTWTSSSTATATISASGVATGVAAGTTSITATSGGITSAGVTLTVTAAVLQSVTIAGATSSIAAGQTDAFTATGHFSDGTTQTLTTGVAWTSSNPAAATITGTGTGTALGVAAGTTSITATSGGITSAGVTLTVTAAVLQSIAVTPTTASIAAGLTQQYTATGTYSNGTTAALTTGVTWTSSSTATATISASGVATGVAAGTTSITAASGSVTSPGVTLTVTAAGPVSITLIPTSGVQGQTVTIGVTGVNTLFVNGTTTATFGSSGAITVNSVTVTSSTTASLNVTISPTAVVGVYTLAMTTGTQIVQANFTVSASSASISSIAPSSEPQGFGAVSLVVTGSGTHFANGTTTAGITGGVTVNSVVVSSLTSATVNVTVSASATAGAQTVTLTTGGEVETGTFTVTAGTPQISLLNPSSGNEGATLSVAVTGLYTHFGPTSVGSFSGTGITVNSTTASDATDAVLNITIAANASLGPRNVTITTGAEVASITGQFSVQSGVATITTNPTTAMQGQSFTLMVNGSFTHFVQGTTTISFAGGYATVGTVSVSGPTLLSVPVTVSDGAPAGPTTVSATTGTEVASVTFNIAAGIPGITIISPNVGTPNSTATVTVTSQFTNFVQGTTQASFGPSIKVSGGPSGGFGTVTVTSPTSFTATLVIATGATLGAQTVQVKTGTQTLSVTSGFNVQNASTTPPAVLQTTPVIGATGVPVNTLIQVEFTEPINRATAIASNVQLSDSQVSNIPVSVSLDASGRILTVTPSQVLAVGRAQVLYVLSGIQDVYGNNFVFGAQSPLNFTTAYSTVTTGPSVIGTNPASGATGVPTNTTIVVGFSAPISPLTQPAGLTVTQGGTAVPGTFAFSTNAQQISFVPTNPFTAGATYAINYNSQLTDFASNALINPGTATFTAGSISDTTGPTVTGFNPANGSIGVGLNAPFIVMFSKAIDPLSLTVSQFALMDIDTNYEISGNIAVAANATSATFTPSEPLLPNTSYVFNVATCAYICLSGGYTDVAGNTGSGSYTVFTTGTAAVTAAPTVVSINPPNGTTSSVPVNVQIAAVISTQVDPLTVATSSITLTPSVAGTVTLASDGVTLQLAPTANLAAATTYTVHVSGIKDVNGNTLTSFTSTFVTNGTTETTAPTVTVNPVYAATIATLTTPVVLTFSGPINPQTVNNGTVYAVQYTANGSSSEVAGTLAVSGGNTAVTLTPISPWVPSTVANNSYVYVFVSGVQDPEGNSISTNSIFYTPVTTQTVAPLTITSLTPASGATGVGQNAVVSVTFSHSVNPATVTGTTLALFAGDSNIGAGISMSADNRTAMLTTTLPVSSTITVTATTAITDLFGNALTGNLTSQFTTAATPPSSSPSIVTMRPGYGATGVPTSNVITLFANAPLNASTVNGGVHVSQNGVLVSGSANTIGDGTSIEFVPTGSFTYGALIEVNVDQTVTDQYGNPLNAFYGSFTVTGNPVTTAPVLIATSPVVGAEGVPLNAAVYLQFSQALNSSSVSSSTAYLTDQNNSIVPASVTLLPSGNTIEIKPSSNLAAGTSPTSTYYQVNVTTGVQNTSGLPLAALYTGYFYAGTTADTTAPTVLGVAPPNNQQNVGLNGLVVVTFSEPINPITANSSTVSLSYGTAATTIPTSVSFNSTNTQVTFTPTTPLPPSTTVTVAITNGVQDVAGNAVTAQATTFKTAATADTVGPAVTITPLNGATNVPSNTVVVIQYSEPINAQTVSPTYNYLYDSSNGQNIAANLTVSANGLTATLAPTGPLPVGTVIYVYSSQAQDLSGNVQAGINSVQSSFTTSYDVDTTVPQVIGTNPANGATAVPTNTVVDLYFNESVNPASLSQVTLSEGGATVPTMQTLSNGNQTLSLTPATPLLPTASYTITAIGVKDTAGNQLAATFTSAFTTGLTIDLVGPTVTGFNPVYGSTGVGLNAPLIVMFSKPINPLSLTASQFALYDYNTAYKISGTIAVAANAMSATFTPAELLQTNTSYVFEVAGCFVFSCTIPSGYTDVAGNTGSGSYTLFTTSTTIVATAPTVVSINPPNGTATTVPQDVYIAAVISTQVDPLTVSGNSITLTPAAAGTVTLAADQVTLEFVPNTNLAASTTYTVNVGGFKDVNGNTVTPFTSTFKTNGTPTSTEPTVTVNPAYGATIATLTTPVIFTFSGPINPQTINSGSVYATQYTPNGNAEVAGTLAVSGGNTIVTFTPLSPWAPSTAANNAYIVMNLNGVQDPEGDAGIDTSTIFYTPITSPVVTPLTVTSVTPANGATGVGQNAVVAIVFSHSVNPATVSQATLALYVGNTFLNVPPSISADNRTATFTTVLPPSSTITVVSWPGITDLSGNALTTNLDSQFNTAATPPNSGPSIVTMLPGNGATGVPTNAVITLFANAPLNQSTVNGGFHIVQNGVTLAGTTNITGAGTSIEFVPGAPLTYGALIEVHLDSTITDQSSNPLTAFYGSFTVVGSPATTAPVVVAVSPTYGATGVPLNASAFVQFSQALKASTVSSSTAYMMDQNNNLVPSTATLLASGNTIQIKPSSPLAAGTSPSSTYYYVYVTSGLQNSSGVPYTGNGSFYSYFYTGAAADTTAPAVLGVAPPNNQQNVGLNGLVEVTFSKPINPLTVNSTSVSLSYGSTPTQIPTTVTFDSTNTYVTFTPAQPLPASTTIKLTISGVQDVAGNSVTTQSTTFVTGAAADTTAPTVVANSPANGATNVPTNASVVLQFSEPMNLASIVQYYCANPDVFYNYFYSNCLNDATLATAIPANVSVSADGMSAIFTPKSALTPGDTVNVYSYAATDLAGNVETAFSTAFTVGSVPDTTPPQVLSVNPINNLTSVPINAIVQVLFDRPVAANSLNGVTLKANGSTVVTSPALSSAGQLLTLNTPDLLTPGTTYTIAINGVADLAGNTMSTAVTDIFTTGTGAILLNPSVVNITPANGATMVATNSPIVLQFSNPMNPVSLNTSSFILTVTGSSAAVPGTFTLSSDAKTVTFTPTSALASGSVQYTLTIPSPGYLQPNQVSDVALNPVYPPFTSFFQTQ